tara:strand:+ start:1702 stop:3030 length:1329 start_codon:yes stop_codon:yes gene_type:complete
MVDGHLYKKSNLNFKNKNIIYALLSFFLVLSEIFAQNNKSIIKISLNPTNYNYAVLDLNNYGKSTINAEIEYKWNLKKNNTEYQITLSNAYNSYRTKHKMSYDGSVDYKINHWLLLGESFIKYNFTDKTFIRIGQYYRDFSNYLNDNLSSGSMLISKNAQAMPKVGLVTDRELTKKMALKFGIAHGFLDKEGYYLEAPALHEKFIYLNLKVNNNDKISMGFVHEAMWGGHAPETSEYPDTIKDFFKVFISADGPYAPPHANALGSHLGIWDFYYEKNNGNKKVKLYYQHFFEDTSSLRFANNIDGLWGFELQNYLPNTNVLVEYLDTSHASGSTAYKNDYYYWNYQYRVGWVFKDKIIGNPFVNTNYFTEEQSIKLINIGISGEFNSNIYEIRAFRNIKMDDSVKLKLSYVKSISKKTSTEIFFAVQDGNYGVGLSLSYSMK